MSVAQVTTFTQGIDGAHSERHDPRASLQSGYSLGEDAAFTGCDKISLGASGGPLLLLLMLTEREKEYGIENIVQNSLAQSTGKNTVLILNYKMMRKAKNKIIREYHHKISYTKTEK